MVDAAVIEALRLVPDDRVVHHRRGAVEVAASEGLVRTANSGEIVCVRGQGRRVYAVFAAVINYQLARRADARSAPARSPGSTRVASSGPQVPRAYGQRRGVLLQHGVDDAPGGLDRVLAREQPRVARERVAEQALVGLRALAAERLLVGHVEVDPRG